MLCPHKRKLKEGPLHMRLSVKQGPQDFSDWILPRRYPSRSYQPPTRFDDYVQLQYAGHALKEEMV